MAPFRAPLLDFPAAAGIPVHLAVLRYRAPLGLPPASESMCWWGEMTFLPHFFNLFRMAGMQADLVFAPAAFSHPDRKRLAGTLQLAAEEGLGRLDAGFPAAPRKAMA